MKIGIVIIATNAYFVLGVRFMKKFLHFYKGDKEIVFHFFSDTDPSPYIDANIVYYTTQHDNWVDATNSKFTNILSLSPTDSDYLFYFDADTSVDRDFTEEWFIGDLVGGQHYNNATGDPLPFERNLISKAFVPYDSPLPYMYYYGAFFGGSTPNMLEMCNALLYNQLEDKKIPYEPGVNDESYINNYFHYHPPIKTVLNKDFGFVISHKGGLGDTRFTTLDTSLLKETILNNKDILWDIKNGKICLI